MSDATKTEIAQTLYFEWLKGVKGLGTVSKKERLQCFTETAQYAFEAATEFLKASEKSPE